MPRKSASAPAKGGITDPQELRPKVLKVLVEIMEQTPPLGERYEDLLKEMILQAYQQEDGGLGDAEKKQFLDEIFSYANSLGPLESLLDDPQTSEIMVNGCKQVFIEQEGQLILTDIKYDNDVQVRPCHQSHP